MIEAVIFDMDGTLINSEPIWRIAECAAFEKIGIPLTEKQIETHTVGMRNDEMVAFWFSYFNLKDDALNKEVQKDIIEKVISLTTKEGHKNGMPGLSHILAFFKNKNIPIAVASSSPLDVIYASLKAAKIENSFQIIQSAVEESFGKPHPAVFIHTAQKMNVNPLNCLVFEDSINGCIAAKAAKMKCVAIPSKNDFSKKAYAIADVKLDSFLAFNTAIFEQF